MAADTTPAETLTRCEGFMVTETEARTVREVAAALRMLSNNTAGATQEILWAAVVEFVPTPVLGSDIAGLFQVTGRKATTMRPVTFRQAIVSVCQNLGLTEITKSSTGW